MSNFKCDKCKTEVESLWMFGPFGVAFEDKKEYCESCFSSRLAFFGLRKPEVVESHMPEVVESSLVS